MKRRTSLALSSSAWLGALVAWPLAVGPVLADEPPNLQHPQSVVIVVGAPGTDEYGKQFAAWADRWESAARRANAEVVRIGGDTAKDTAAKDVATKDVAIKDADPKLADRDRLREQLAAAATRGGGGHLWLVLIGHGTYDGRLAKFNLRGPDVTAAELAEWCAAVKRPLAVIDCSSASGPLLAALSGPQRVVITATRSGQEQNFARFGDDMSAAIGDLSADLDKDGQTSLLEAYLHASRRVEEFYNDAARLATEHALLDDNGDGLGTPAAWFQGVRATRKAKDGAAVDGPLAHRWHLITGDEERLLAPAARQRRDELEQAIARLRETKGQLPEEEYFKQLERLLIEVARLNAAPAKPAE